MGLVQRALAWLGFSRARRAGADEVMPPAPWDGWPAGWSTGWEPQRHLAENLGIVFGCVDRISSALTSMPIQATFENRAAVPRPPRWIEDPPSPAHTHVGDGIGEALTSLLLDGNAYLYCLARDAQSYPAYWTALPSDQVTISPDGRTYTLGLTAAHPGIRPQEIRMTGDPRVDDLLHIRYQPRAGTPYGVGPLESVHRQVRSLAGLEEISGTLAGEGGIPSGILTGDQIITPEAAKKHKQAWQDSVKAGEVAVLGNGLAYKPVTLSPRDMALLELRQVDGRMIAVAFGVPPFLVGMAEAGDLTYSTVQGQMEFFHRVTLRPIATNVGRALTRWAPRGTYIWFDSDDYVRPPIAEYVQALAVGVGAGFIDDAEARTEIGYPPRDPAGPQPGVRPLRKVA